MLLQTGMSDIALDVSRVWSIDYREFAEFRVLVISFSTILNHHDSVKKQTLITGVLNKAGVS